MQIFFQKDDLCRFFFVNLQIGFGHTDYRNNMKSKHLIVTLLLCLATIAASAQKSKGITFSPDGLPDQLVEYLNSATSDDSKKKSNTKLIKQFTPLYESMTSERQQQVTQLYAYTQKARLKPVPDVADLTSTLMLYAQKGDDALGGWLAALSRLEAKNSKAKAVGDFVDFSQKLMAENKLYHTGSSDWSFTPGAQFTIGVDGGDIVVTFAGTIDLTLSSNRDQSTIHQTSGQFNYTTGRWQGKGGHIDWGRTGLDRAECWANLATYEANVKFPKFSADSVEFVNTKYFATPIKGRIDEAVANAMEPSKYNFPRFRSYQKDFVIKDILPGVDYSGSFMMNGSKFITADSLHEASLIFYRGGRRQLAVTSRKFTISPDRAVSENASVAFYIGDDDSIYNNGILVRYQAADHKVTLINDPKRSFYSPYTDTYHGLDVYCEAIVWNTNSDQLDFATIGQSGSSTFATFESANYYTYKKFREIQGIDDINPVMRVHAFAEANGSTFGIKKFSNFLGLDITQTKLMIHNLTSSGLVSYNDNTGRVVVKPKLYDYVYAYRKSKDSDYDAISLESSSTGRNATMSLDSSALMMTGVDRFVVSDSQHVVVYPRGGKLQMKQNRDFAFSGRINVGRFVFFVTNASFSYDDYSFDLPKVDSMFFFVSMFNNPDSEHIVLTPLHNLVGTLKIDESDNHSGLKKNKQYPIFNSLDQSYVYYDMPSIQHGQYSRDKFYYTLTPFTLYSLGDFETDSLRFNGVLTSAGIFPDIKEPLTVQPDYYLGFSIQTSDNGLPAYGGKGQYTKNLKLNQKGLHGGGKLGYLTSVSHSKDFLFLPDSALAVTDTFIVRPGQGFPDIRNGRASIHWLPYLDSMAVSTLHKGAPFAMYGDQAKFVGRIDLKPAGATATGTATIDEGELRSPRFALQTDEMSAAVTDFTLISRTFNNVAFAAQNIQSRVDYNARTATFQTNGEMQKTELRLAKYESYADKFTWDMDRHNLAFINSSSEGSDGMEQLGLKERIARRSQPGAHFVSTDPTQKRLEFHAVGSAYHYEQGTLGCTGVYLIKSADAYIAPGADTLFVRKGGKMAPLHKAQAIADGVATFHHIFDAELQIAASDSYSGSGTIYYTDEDNNQTPIHLTKIETANGTTIGTGTIADSAGFTLNSAFGFAGKVRVEGNRQHYWFEGGVRLIQDCLPVDQLGLLAYAGYTDPASVRVTVPELPTDWRGNRITASILLDKTSLRPHSAFLTKERPADNELMGAYGVLTYSKVRNQYLIGAEDKVADPENVAGPYLSMDLAGCAVEGEGPINFALRRTQAELFCYGSARLDLAGDEEVNLNTIFAAGFPIAPALAESLAQHLQADLSLQPSKAFTNPTMRHALMHHLGAEKGSEAYSQYAATGHFDKLPKIFGQTLVFDNIKWLYSPAMGYYFDGRTNLVSVGGKQLNLQVKLKAQITKKGNNQQMVLLLQASKDHWYYFHYDFGTQELTLYSSIGEWVDQVKSLPLESRKVSVEGLGTFRYFIGNSPRDVGNYITWFSKTAYGSDDEDY